jgi:hypothetical protein
MRLSIAAVLRNGVKRVRQELRCCQLLVLRSVDLASGWHPSRFVMRTLREVGPRASRHCGLVL